MKALPLAFGWVALVTTASAQPGTLELTFGSGGVATFTVDDVWVPATDILPMPDGDNLVVSISRDDQYIDRMLLMRLNPDGTLDNAFGQGGMVRWSPGSLGMRAQGSKLLPDGKLLVCGNLINGNQLASASLYRFNADGTPDTSFGTNGRTLIPHVDANDNLYDMVVLGNGQILCVGEWQDATSGAILVARFNEDGSLDSGFGSGGVLIHEMFPGLPERALSLFAATDGNYHVYCVRSYTTIFVFGLQTNGQVNSAYGTSGMFVLNVASPSNNAKNAAHRPDGTLVAAEVNAAGQVQLYCLDNAGDLVPSFGNNGTIVPNQTSDPHHLNRMQALPDGSLLGSGSLNDPGPGSKSMFTHYTESGDLDPGFGTNGNLLLPYFMFPGSYALTPLPNGKIITVANNLSNSTQAVVHVLQLNGPAVGIPELSHSVADLNCGSGADAAFVDLATGTPAVSSVTFHDITGKVVAQVAPTSTSTFNSRSLQISYPTAMEPGCYVMRLQDRTGKPIGNCAVVKAVE